MPPPDDCYVSQVTRNLTLRALLKIFPHGQEPATFKGIGSGGAQLEVREGRKCTFMFFFLLAKLQTCRGLLKVDLRKANLSE